MTPIILRAVLLGACATLAVPAALAQCAGVAAGQTEQNAAAELVSLVGRGETRPSGDAAWERAVQAQKLKGGADMRTLARSFAALLLADRTQIRMSSNAQLRLCDTQPERSLLELIAGRLWARTKRSPANLQLQTPAALAVVRGTDWDVEVDAAGRTTLTVLSGRVELSNPQGSVQLGPAEQGYAEPGQAPVKRLLVRPRERVQWVMAHPGSPTRWAEGGAAADLVQADQDVMNGQLDAAQERLERAWQRTQDPRAAARRAVGHVDRGDFALRLQKHAAMLRHVAGKLFGYLVLRGDRVAKEIAAARANGGLRHSLVALPEFLCHALSPFPR